MATPHAATRASRAPLVAPRRAAEPALPDPCRTCAVRALSVCAALKGAEMAGLAGIVGRSQYPAGATIMMEGDPADHLFNIIEGTVQIYRLLPDGRRQITGFLMGGDFLGLALNDTNPYSAEAVGTVSLCRLPRRRFEQLIDQFPQLERRMLVDASNELFAAQEQMLLLGRKTAREKVATFLLMLARRAARRGKPDDEIVLAMSRAGIGDYLGLTIETVSRTITRLRRDGILALHGANRVEIVDREALEDAAEG
ncbi:MAG: cyclic nucleotide-binding domain-containing protein [Proteobacteria bacterium]|nr:cyclic nucleotide-binding domain-containing protein [Pseudomonadota bacterium]